MHPNDQYILTGILYCFVSIAISGFSTILIVRKISLLKWRLFSYSIILLVGLACLIIWPIDENGRIIFLESLIGLGLIIPVFVVLSVRSLANMNKSLIEKKIKDYQAVARALNIEVNGIEKSRNSQQHYLSFGGILSNQLPFSISETTDFFQESKGTNKTNPIKRDYHFTVFRFFLSSDKSTPFRILTNNNHYANNETSFENTDLFKSHNSDFEDKISILYPKNSNLKYFFAKPRIQMLLHDNYDNIRGFMDFNIENGLCTLKSASPSQNNIKVFNANWRNEVNQLTINDLKRKLDFADAFLKELSVFEAYA